jgi:hypothetical protein
MMYPLEIQTELDRAEKALAEKNEGLTRVCCRRAAGAAIRRWLAAQPQPPAWGTAAITQLRTLVDEETVPTSVRNAAARLSTTVAKDHTLPFDNNPIDDARIIIQHFVA